LIILISAVAQKVIRNEPWNTRHLIFGLELVLTTFSLSIVMLLEWGRVWLGVATSTVSAHSYPIFAGIAFVSMFCMVFSLSEYQDYYRRYPTTSPEKVPFGWYCG
jgi:hypothetical protein